MVEKAFIDTLIDSLEALGVSIETVDPLEGSAITAMVNGVIVTVPHIGALKRERLALKTSKSLLMVLSKAFPEAVGTSGFDFSVLASIGGDQNGVPMQSIMDIFLSEEAHDLIVEMSTYAKFNRTGKTVMVKLSSEHEGSFDSLADELKLKGGGAMLTPALIGVAALVVKGLLVDFFTAFLSQLTKLDQDTPTPTSKQEKNQNTTLQSE